MTSYLVNKEDVVNFLDNPNMKNQDGYMFAYVTSPEVLARLVPKPLTPIAPVIAGYITMELGTSSDDPVSELTVLKPVGGAHYQMTSGKMHETIQLAQVEPDEIAPYLITGRYDQAILGK